jgi:hypothetical protein
LNSSNISNIPQTFVAANALDESKKQSDFSQEFEQSINDLTIDETVTKIAPTKNDLLTKIKQTKTQMVLLKNNTEFELLSKKLTHLIQQLIEQLQKTNCKKTKTSLVDVFKQVDSHLFKPQLTLLKNELNEKKTSD